MMLCQSHSFYQNHIQLNSLTGRCAVLPKNDTLSIEAANLDPSHELVFSIYCPITSDVNGQARLVWEERMLVKTEKLVLGKEYSLYNDEVKAEQMGTCSLIPQHRTGQTLLDQ
ncbi:hypothetical protein [Lacrimispora celerecrescens]|uniref:hypothetical protein n=1 Tax=Lacrimispora celerecrescens TaxID=29354 RepID=UPI000570DAD6|nr:hypothetical protein [Lacrimispora celerecrescens]